MLTLKPANCNVTIFKKSRGKGPERNTVIAIYKTELSIEKYRSKQWSFQSKKIKLSLSKEAKTMRWMASKFWHSLFLYCKQMFIFKIISDTEKYPLILFYYQNNFNIYRMFTMCPRH